jgi:SHAQKYF class myb-like DNA-binding protein
MMNKKKKKKKRPRTDDAAVAGRWTAEEHALFLQGLAEFGREWKRVAQDIPTRSSSQVRSHAQKYFAKLAKQQQMQHQQQIQMLQLLHPEEGEEADDHDDDDEHNAASEIVMSDSVRQQAARILAHPESVCAEVTQTLLALKERHQQLQRRLLLQQQQQAMEEEEHPREQQRQHAVISLDNEEEMIALHVLRGGLPRPKSPHDK